MVKSGGVVGEGVYVSAWVSVVEVVAYACESCAAGDVCSVEGA